MLKNTLIVLFSEKKTMFERSILIRSSAFIAGVFMLCLVSTANAIPLNGNFDPLTFGPGDLSEEQFSCVQQVNPDPHLCAPLGGEATRTITVFNNTGVNWTDFHLRVASDGDSIVFPQSLISNPSGFTFVANGDELSLFGSILNSTQFTVTFKLEPAVGPVPQLPPFQLYGTPSFPAPTPAPEPATIVTLGFALAGFGLAQRKRVA